MATHLPFIYRWSTLGLPGSWEVLPYLCPAHRPRPRRLRHCHLSSPVLPPQQRTRRPQLIQYFEADSHGFSTLCLRFQLRLSLHWQDSIPAGGSPYRVGFEPTGLLQLISSAALSPPIPKLQAYSWRHSAPCFLLSSNTTQAGGSEGNNAYDGLERHQDPWLSGRQPEGLPRHWYLFV